MILKWLLFEGQRIYIIGSVGSQSIECFKKLEDIAMQRVQSSKSLKDIFANETVKSPACKTGFVHNPASHSVFSYNDSGVFTLNGDPDNIRSKRASFVFFDESAFSDEELLVSGIAFATQSTDFVTSTDEGFDPRMEKMKCPTQLLFASSMNDTSCLFYKKFKDYSMKMFMGDTKNYFVTSMPCDAPLHPLMDGKPFPPLLKQSQIDDEMRVNPQKALREYYNMPHAEHEDQMIKQATIIRNSTFLFPELSNKDNKSRFITAQDSARAGDNSIFAVMKVCRDENIGYYGEVVNCVNFVDIGKKKKMNLKVDDQTKLIREYLLLYNGKNPDYSNIEEFLIDSGAGGQGTSIADLLIHEWEDDDGIKHKGLIDETHDLYKEEAKNYPNASRKLKLINPKKYRNQMCGELAELITHDLIKFPKEYDGKDYMVIEATNEKGEVELVERKLTTEEKIALINIDAMKSEMYAIHKVYDSDGTVKSYINPNQHAKDDRFYTLLLLAHKLYELRRNDILTTDNDPYESSQLVWY